MKLSDFDYDLPQDLIAQEPMSPRDHSRLMIIDEKGYTEHKRFYHILDYLKKGDVLVLNQTKVYPARLKGKKKTGSKIELLITSTYKKRCKGHIRERNPKPGQELLFGKYKATIIDQAEDVFFFEFNHDVESIMKDIGEMPIPPYIKKKLDKDSQYQTIYSKNKGSVAAPTAGLHFTEELIRKIEEKGIKIAKVTLHVGLGTFLPVKDLKTHKMHEEQFEITKKDADIINKRQGKLAVVGTTSLRALESSSKEGKSYPKKGITDIFIKPGYRFQSGADMLITNFHLPNSTLLMLVSAFAGKENIDNIYKTAIKEKYRFYSFGDAMLLNKVKDL